MKGLTLSIALLVALLTSNAFAADPESEDQMSEMENPRQPIDRTDQKQLDKENSQNREIEEDIGHDGMKGMEGKAEQRERRMLEEDMDHGTPPDADDKRDTSS